MQCGSTIWLKMWKLKLNYAVGIRLLKTTFQYAQSKCHIFIISHWSALITVSTLYSFNYVEIRRTIAVRKNWKNTVKRVFQYNLCRDCQNMVRGLHQNVAGCWNQAYSVKLRLQARIAHLQHYQTVMWDTYFVCPLNILSATLPLTSNSRTTESSHPATSSWPSDLNLPLYAVSLNRVNVFTGSWENGP